MQTNFSPLNHLKPELEALSDADLEKWGRGVMRRQKIRTRVYETLRIGATLTGTGLSVGIAAWLFSSIVLPLSYLVVPASLGLMILCGVGVNGCENNKTSPDTVRLNNESARREELARQASAPPFNLRPCAEDFADAVLNGVEKNITVGKPLHLVNKVRLKNSPDIQFPQKA
jgi:hypothetical protein